MFSATRGCVGVRILDLDDGDLNRLADHLGNISLQLLNLLAARTDDKARTSTLDQDLNFLGSTLDLDCRNTCILQQVLQVLTDVVVFHEEIAKDIVLCEPTGIPILDYADTETVRINFLAHCLTSPYSFSARTRVT